MSGNTNRHIRMSDFDWERAKARAGEEGTTVSAVVREFVVAYGRGDIPSRFDRVKEHG